MADSRKELKKYLNKECNFEATIGEVTHKKLKTNSSKKQLVILLLNVKLINNKTKRKRTVSDHMWVNFTKDFLTLKEELFYKDKIKFKAKVSKYNIVRDDVLSKRDKIFNDAIKENNKLFEEFQKKMDKWYNDYDNVKQINNNIYEQYQNHLLSYDEMKKAQQDLWNKRNKEKPNIDKIKKIQQRKLKSAQKKQEKEELVDYKLVNVKNVHFVDKKNVHYGWTRELYDKNRIDDYNYSSYLAARSFAYQNKTPFNKF